MVSTLGQLGVILGAFLGKFGVNPGSTLDRPAVSRGQPGVNLGSTRGETGSNSHHSTMSHATPRCALSSAAASAAASRPASASSRSRSIPAARSSASHARAAASLNSRCQGQPDFSRHVIDTHFEPSCLVLHDHVTGGCMTEDTRVPKCVSMTWRETGLAYIARHVTGCRVT